MKVFLTGGTGFIGKHLVRFLVKKNCEVVVLIRDKNNEILVKEMGAKAVIGSLDDQKNLGKLLHGIDVCCHLSAIRNDWGYPWEEYYRVNVLGTENLLKAAAKNKIKHFLFVSSVKAGDFNNYYGKSKLIAENIAKRYYKENKLPLTIVRPTIVYGPGDSQSSMFYKLAKLIKDNKFMMIGNGRNLVHFLFIDDLINALWLAMKKPGSGETYFLASKKPIEFGQFVKLIAKEVNGKIPNFYIPVFFAIPIAVLLEFIYKFLVGKEPLLTRDKIMTFTVSRFFSIKKAEEKIGFSPKVNYSQGIQKTVLNFKEENA